MNATRRNWKIRRAYGITEIKHIGNVSSERKAQYLVSFLEGDPVTVDVPLCGHTESSVLGAVIYKIKDRPIRYRP